MKRTSVSCIDTNRLVCFAHNYMRIHNDRCTLGEVFAEKDSIRHPIILIKIVTHPEKPHVVAVNRGYSQRLYHNSSNASFYRIARLATTSSIQHLGELTEYIYRYKRKEQNDD